MAQIPGKEKREQELARTQRQELKAELADNYAQLPRRPRNRRRIITFIVLSVLALLAGIFGWLVLLPSPSQQPVAGVAIGTAAPEFKLPIYGGSGVGGSIDLRALRGHPVILNFWSESCPPVASKSPTWSVSTRNLERKVNLSFWVSIKPIQRMILPGLAQISMLPILSSLIRGVQLMLTMM